MRLQRIVNTIQNYMEAVMRTAERNGVQDHGTRFIPGQRSYGAHVLSAVKANGCFFQFGPILPSGVMDGLDWIEDISLEGGTTGKVVGHKSLNPNLEIYQGHGDIYPLHMMIEGLCQTAGMIIPHQGLEGKIFLQETSGKMMGEAVLAETAIDLRYTATIKKYRANTNRGIVRATGQIHVRETGSMDYRLVAQSKAVTLTWHPV